MSIQWNHIEMIVHTLVDLGLLCVQPFGHLLVGVGLYTESLADSEYLEQERQISILCTSVGETGEDFVADEGLMLDEMRS